MERSESVACCVAEMNKMPQFAAHDDDTKAKAANYVFDRLHEDAATHLPFGASEDDLKHYAKAALRRVHDQTSALPPRQFEQQYGFPILLVLGLIPTLWSWWKLLREWLNW